MLTHFLITTKVASFGGRLCWWSEFCFLVVGLSLSLSPSPLIWIILSLWVRWLVVVCDPAIRSFDSIRSNPLSFLSSFLWWALDFSFGFPVITWELGCSNWIFCEVCCVWGLTWLRLTLKDWNLRVEEWGFGWELHVGGWCLCCFSVLWQVWDPWGTELIHGVMRYVYCVVISFWLLCLRLVLELAPILVFWSVNQWIVIVNLNLVCYAFVLALKLIISCFKFSF